MNINFLMASQSDAQNIAEMVVKLTNEICELTKAQHFDISLMETVKRCRVLLNDGHYRAIVGFDDKKPIAVVTLSETHALYAGGKVGLIQEFYVKPEYRAAGLGAMLVKQVKELGLQENWSCIELCTPPLPEFERTLTFYQRNDFKAVGGRKMRQSLSV